MANHKPKVYLETSIISYLTSLPSCEQRVLVMQQITHDWWNKRRAQYQLVVSPVVIDENAAGDREASKRRMALIRNLPVLNKYDDALLLAAEFIRKGIIPAKAKLDALHVAFAAVNGIEYLLTWNCRHIANAEIERQVRRICERSGSDAPYLCTPLELMGE